MTQATLVKLNVCDCGYPLLNESISLGTIYNLELERRQRIGLYCGGCGMMINGLDGVYVYGRLPGQSNGYLPIVIFEVDGANDVLSRS